MFTPVIRCFTKGSTAEVGYNGSFPPLTANIGLFRRLFGKTWPSSMSPFAITMRKPFRGRKLA
jgi:hypothetical protein